MEASGSSSREGLQCRALLPDGRRQALEVPPLVDVTAAEAVADPVLLEPCGGRARADVDGQPVDMGGLRGRQDPAAGLFRSAVLGDGLVVEPLLRRDAAEAGGDLQVQPCRLRRGPSLAEGPGQTWVDRPGLGRWLGRIRVVDDRRGALLAGVRLPGRDVASRGAIDLQTDGTITTRDATNSTTARRRFRARRGLPAT